MSKKIVLGNNIVPNLKKLPLSEYFAALPKAERRPVIISAPKEDVITAIAEATQRNRHTVRCWMYGYTRPNSMVEKNIVADILQSDVTILFPDKEEGQL